MEINGILVRSIAVEAREGRKSGGKKRGFTAYKKFSNDLFVTLIKMIASRYAKEKMLFWEAMRFSLNDLKLSKPARVAYRRAVGAYFNEQKRIRIELEKQARLEAESREPKTGEVMLKGNQYEWKI